jgi:hypothetical protein
MKTALSALILFVAAPAWAAPPGPGPLDARIAQEFRGWKVIKKVQGDLNGDSLPDAVVTLNRKGQAMLAILFATPGGFRVHTRAPRAVCASCGGPKGVGPDEVLGTPAVNAKKVLSISYWGGSREIWSAEMKWRLDPQADRFVLIGETRTSADGDPDGPSADTTEDINHLTHKMIVKEGKARRRCDVKPDLIELDDFDFDENGMEERAVEGSCK